MKGCIDASGHIIPRMFGLKSTCVVRACAPIKWRAVHSIRIISLLLMYAIATLKGLFVILECDNDDDPHSSKCPGPKYHERNQVYAGFSRDGFHWTRTTIDPVLRRRVPLCGLNESSAANWNWEDVQAAAGGFVVHDDEMAMYTSGRRIPKLPVPAPPSEAPQVDSTGRAVLRRDGFASITGATVSLTTKPMVFSAPRRYLYVNWDAGIGDVNITIHQDNSNSSSTGGGNTHNSANDGSSGSHIGLGAGLQGAELLVEVRDAATQLPIQPFTLANCTVAGGGGTRVRVHWAGDDAPGGSGLSALAGRPIQLYFAWSTPPPWSISPSPSRLPVQREQDESRSDTNNRYQHRALDHSQEAASTPRLYSFWFASTECGESSGCVIIALFRLMVSMASLFRDWQIYFTLQY
jgi:hypothetical protein